MSSWKFGIAFLWTGDGELEGIWALFLWNIKMGEVQWYKNFGVKLSGITKTVAFANETHWNKEHWNSQSRSNWTELNFFIRKFRSSWGCPLFPKEEFQKCSIFCSIYDVGQFFEFNIYVILVKLKAPSALFKISLIFCSSSFSVSHSNIFGMVLRHSPLRN